MSAKSLVSPLILAIVLPALGQQNLESAFRTTGTAVVAAFEPQRQILQTSSAVILAGRKEIAYGVVISSEGHVLTKSSEIHGVNGLQVTVDKTNYREVKVLAVDPTWDVALLKIETTGLIPVVFAPTSNVPQGTWVVANGATTRTTRRLLPGIVSAKIREIPPAGGAALGVVLNTEGKKLEIDEVNERGGAKDAGMLKGDVILSIEGTKVAKVEDIADVLKERKAGSIVKVVFRRDQKEVTADVRLAARSEMFEQGNRNDQMSGEFSSRRSGFPRVMQHDILGSKNVIGGPVLDLDGRCIGMNIARANRAESFAIPVEDLKALAVRLIEVSKK